MVKPKFRAVQSPAKWLDVPTMPLPIPDCRRFWVLRGEDPELADGFLLDPESGYGKNNGCTGVPFESIGTLPILGLLGEPGIGKSTALKADYDRTKGGAPETDHVSWIDLGLYGSDVLLCKKVFGSRRLTSWNGTGRMHLFFDGFDECLGRVHNLVGLLLEFLNGLPLNRLSLRIACRTADWPEELETGLAELCGRDAMGVYQLAPLRYIDVYSAIKAVGLPPDEFCEQVIHLGAGPLASRPITLKFLLDSFKQGKGLPSRRADLYREGCSILCAEWRDSRKRAKRLSFGQRFAIASRLAAAVKFCRRTALWTGHVTSLHRMATCVPRNFSGGKSVSNVKPSLSTQTRCRKHLIPGFFAPAVRDVSASHTKLTQNISRRSIW